MRRVLAKAKDLVVFRLVQQLETRRTLPAMVDDDNLLSSHEGISHLIA